MSIRVERPKSEELFDQLCSAKRDIANLVASDLGYVGIPRYEHIHAASLMIEARMLAMESNPRTVTARTPIEKAVQRFVELNLKYSDCVAGAE